MSAGDLGIQMINVFKKLLLIMLAGILVAVALYSLQWRVLHDSPIMLYIGMLIDRYGFVPYRDFFDMNMAGTDFAYAMIGRLSGYTDFGTRVIDLLWLSAIMAFAFLRSRKFGWEVAAAGALLFGLLYLKSGPYNSLQREYLLILPIVVGLWVSSLARFHWPVKNVLVGLCFGVAATMKPHAAIGLPIVLIFLCSEITAVGHSRWRSLLFGTLAAILGFSLPILAMIGYLALNGALFSFLDVAKNYWPLYSGLTGTHQPMEGITRFQWLFEQYRQLGGSQLWLAPGLMGSYVALFRSSLPPAQRRQIIMLVGLTICYSIYPALAGKFWYYHWLPYIFFILQLSALCLVDQSRITQRFARTFPLAIFTLAILLNDVAPGEFYDQVQGRNLAPPKDGRVDAIAHFLRENLEPDDTVQPLDWTGGAVHAMLIARAKLATPFVYDFHFYHHISNGYIQNLRSRFVRTLMVAQPRYIIQIQSDDKPWVSGPDTTREFPELQSMMERDYAPAFRGNGYTIHERRAQGR